MIVELMEPPLLVVLALVLAHSLQICTLMLIHVQRQTPQGARLRRWLTRPPCESFEREMSEARNNPHFDQWPFFKHFLVALFVIALVGVLISQVPELALARSDVYWAVLVGLSYYGRGLLGRELVYDPKETFAGISY